jgi:hypothetical protein
MKVQAMTIPVEEPEFYPVAIQLEFETAEEMYEFFCMHNYCPISDRYTDPDVTAKIRTVVQKAYQNSKNTRRFDYQSTFDALETRFNKVFVRKEIK